MTPQPCDGSGGFAVRTGGSGSVELNIDDDFVAAAELLHANLPVWIQLMLLLPTIIRIGFTLILTYFRNIRRSLLTLSTVNSRKLLYV